MEVNKDKIYPSMVIRSQAEAIELLEKENRQLKRQVKIMERYLELIVDLGFDYDGCNTIEGLKGLIDDLVNLASLGRACNTTEPIYVSEEKCWNILHEEIKESDVK